MDIELEDIVFIRTVDGMITATVTSCYLRNGQMIYHGSVLTSSSKEIPKMSKDPVSFTGNLVTDVLKRKKIHAI